MDLLVGWIAGSIIVGLAVDIVLSFAGIYGSAYSKLMSVASLVGTVAGVANAGIGSSRPSGAMTVDWVRVWQEVPG